MKWTLLKLNWGPQEMNFDKQKLDSYNDIG